jgi:hypothetical protein
MELHVRLCHPPQALFGGTDAPPNYVRLRLVRRSRSGPPGADAPVADGLGWHNPTSPAAV